MKKIVLTAVISSLLFSCGIFADDVCSVIGYHDPKTNTYYGPTFCEQTTINGIIVRGPLNTDKSTVDSITDVSGPINSTSTQFNNIIMENNHSSEEVSLSVDSIVKNNIVFKGTHKGIVTLDGSSSVRGKVINGEIIHR